MFSIAVIERTTLSLLLDAIFITIMAGSCYLNLVVSGVPISETNITSIDYRLYHPRDVLLQEVEALAARHPENLHVERLKSEAGGYNSEIVVATFEDENSSFLAVEKYRVLLSFGQHGRELITCEVALRLLHVLVGEKYFMILRNKTIKLALQKMIIKVVPLENYNGRVLVEAGSLCERKNGRGVDINRNWSVDWGRKEPDFDPSEEFPGAEAFSEPETRTMRDLARSFKPHLWINVHSGMQAMFMPYDYKHELPDPSVTKHMKPLLQMLNRLHCNNSCVIGPGGGSVGYLAHGTATDYMYEALGVPLAFTFEVYGDPGASNEDCFRMFNPTDPSLFESTVRNWSMAFITVAIESEKVFKSLPTARKTWRDENGQLSTSSGVAMTARKHLGRANLQYDWVSETRILLGVAFLFSFSSLTFIWCMLLKSHSPRHGAALS